MADEADYRLGIDPSLESHWLAYTGLASRFFFGVLRAAGMRDLGSFMDTKETRHGGVPGEYLSEDEVSAITERLGDVVAGDSVQGTNRGSPSSIMSLRPFAELLAIPGIDNEISDQTARTYLAVFLFYLDLLGDEQNDNPTHFLEDRFPGGAKALWPKRWQELASAVDVLCHTAMIIQPDKPSESLGNALYACIKAAVEQSIESACAFSSETGWLATSRGLDARLLRIAREIAPSENSWENWLMFVCSSTAAYDAQVAAFAGVFIGAVTGVWARDHHLLLYVAEQRDLLERLTGDSFILHRHAKTLHGSGSGLAAGWYEDDLSNASWWVLEHEPEAIDMLRIPLGDFLRDYNDYADMAHDTDRDPPSEQDSTTRSVFARNYALRREKAVYRDRFEWAEGVLPGQESGRAIRYHELRAVVDLCSDHDFSPLYTLSLYARAFDPEWIPGSQQVTRLAEHLTIYLNELLSSDAEALKPYVDDGLDSYDAAVRQMSDTLALIRDRLIAQGTFGGILGTIATFGHIYCRLCREAGPPCSDEGPSTTPRALQ